MLSHQVGDVVVVRGRPYQLLSLMGRGGQGSVFDARDSAGHHVAIKLVPSHTRHRTEARILASLKSEHVVRLLDAGITRDTVILVLERVEGVDLKDLVHLAREEARKIPLKIAVELIQQACQGLLEASTLARLAFHRDIKPGNLILDRSGTLKLLDFGIAHRQDMEYTGSLVGTPENMAPEQVGLDDAWKVDIRTDLYCLGLVLFELLTLETLYRFPQSMPVPERLMVVWHADVRDRLRRMDAIHPALGAFMRRTLQRDPADRFQLPEEMLTALARLHNRLEEAAPLPAFAECVYQLSHESVKTPDLDKAFPPLATLAATLSMELRRPRNTLPFPPVSHWSRASFKLRTTALGVITVLVTAMVLWLFISVLTRTAARDHRTSAGSVSVDRPAELLVERVSDR